MTQLVEAPAAKPDELSFMPLNHVVEGEHQLPSFVLCSAYCCCGIYLLLLSQIL